MAGLSTAGAMSTSSSVALWAAVAVLVGIIWSVMFTTPWRLPAGSVTPSPSSAPSAETTTAPTVGFG